MARFPALSKLLVPRVVRRPEAHAMIEPLLGDWVGMAPNEFIAKWRCGSNERAEARSFFNDLCALAVYWRRNA